MSCECIKDRASNLFQLALVPPFAGVCTAWFAVGSIFEGLSGGACFKEAGCTLKFFANLTTALVAMKTIEVVNPAAKYYESNDNPFSVNELATRKLAKYVETCYQNNSNRFVKHVVSRVAAFGTMLLSLVTRVADIAIGILSFPLAILTLGKVKLLNTLARQGFAAIGLIVSDVILGLSNTINPALHNHERGAFGYLTQDPHSD